MERLTNLKLSNKCNTDVWDSTRTHICMCIIGCFFACQSSDNPHKGTGFECKCVTGNLFYWSVLNDITKFCLCMAHSHMVSGPNNMFYECIIWIFKICTVTRTRHASFMCYFYWKIHFHWLSMGYNACCGRGWNQARSKYLPLQFYSLSWPLCAFFNSKKHSVTFGHVHFTRALWRLLFANARLVLFAGLLCTPCTNKFKISKYIFKEARGVKSFCRSEHFWLNYTFLKIIVCKKEMCKTDRP